MERKLQRYNIVKIQRVEYPIRKIKRIEEVMKSGKLFTKKFCDCILSMTQTEDKRFACGNLYGTISISSYDLETKTWKIDMEKEELHNDGVYSLCALNGNRLLSGGMDSLIKVWSISDADMTLIKEIKEHTEKVWKIIPLSKQRFASCSDDCTVRI